MNQKDLLNRINLVNRNTRTILSNNFVIESNPAIVARYAGKESVSGLARTLTADGGVGYQRSIFNGAVVGGVIPATIQGNSGFGFIDGLG